jgi:hypothetical protein
MKLYRFSPITSGADFKEAINYVVEQELLLAKKAIGKTLPITYLSVFAHYDDEYEKLKNILESWGELSDANNGIKTKLNNPILYKGGKINELRVRQPDPYRMQVGCCDFGVDDYGTFKTTMLEGNKNLRLIERSKYEMVEFFDPDFDVLAYVVSP